MLITTLNPLKSSREMTDTFKGYNHNYRIGDGEFYDMKNLSSDHYPVLSPRKLRSFVNAGTKDGTGLFSNLQGLLVKDDNIFFINGAYLNVFKEGENATTVLSGLSTEEDMLPKQIVSMGAYIIIFPDKVYVNTNDFTDYGNLEVELKLGDTTSITFAHCNALGENICKDEDTEVTYGIGHTTPSDPNDTDVLINVSEYSVNKCEGTVTAYQYYAASNMWTELDLYTRIVSLGIGTCFSKGDTVTISGFSGDYTKYAEADDLSAMCTYLPLLNNTFEISAVEENYIVVKGIIPHEFTAKLNGISVTIKRNVPELDYIIGSNNRLWGCRYGIADNGEMVNEIYASKLGDFKNWYSFQGVSTDSYTASVGTDGPFTGAVNYLGYPIFFKENCMHKIYGSYPAQYQIQTATCRGVEKGSERSLAIVNEILFYKTMSGICAYDGSLPVEVSAALGDVKYSDAVSGSVCDKLYVSMKDLNDNYVLFVYDVSKGLWHKEDDTNVVAFSSDRNKLYYADATGAIKIIHGVGSTTSDVLEDDFEWMAETGVIGLSLPDKKYISKLNVRLLVDVGTRVSFSAQYDSMGGWEYLGTVTGSTLKSFLMPIRVKRCDHMRLRIEGVGDAKIYSITKTIEGGSDK